jgi:hypothetical protein
MPQMRICAGPTSCEAKSQKLASAAFPFLQPPELLTWQKSKRLPFATDCARAARTFPLGFSLGTAEAFVLEAKLLQLLWTAPDIACLDEVGGAAIGEAFCSTMVNRKFTSECRVFGRL